MKKSWGLIPKILSGEKTMESRWYQTKRAPWDKVKPGDTVYFKNSGEPVTAQALVGSVKQYEITSLADAQRIITQYGKRIRLPDAKPAHWKKLPHYCILLELKDPKLVTTPWHVNKSGFGAPAAWLSSQKFDTR